MGASMPGGGGKSASFELNLVPFIDMFSTLICFLLITAAWQSLESVNTGTPPKSVESLEDTPPSEPEPKVKKAVLAVTLFFDRLEVAEDETKKVFPNRGKEIDTQSLALVLVEWKRKYPERKDVILSTENRAPYRHLIRLMDTFIAGQFPEVGITLN